MLPGKYDKFAATPCQMDTRGLEASRCDKNGKESLVVRLTVDASRPQENLPLALWNLPREYLEGTKWFQASENCRFVPVVAPYTGNLNGFLIAKVAKGRSEFTLKISSPKRELKDMDFQIGSGLRGKIFHRDGREMAYIWPTGPWGATLKLRLPAGKSVEAYVAPKGDRQQCAEGETSLQIPQNQWMRLVGLGREEILRFASAEYQSQ